LNPSASGGRVAEHYYPGTSHGGILAGLSIYFKNRRSVLEDIAGFVGNSDEVMR